VPQEAITGVANLREETSRIVTTLLDFLYTSTYEAADTNPEDDIEIHPFQVDIEMYIAARKYQVETLRVLAEHRVLWELEKGVMQKREYPPVSEVYHKFYQKVLRLLRHAVSGLLLNERFTEVLKESPLLSIDLLKLEHGCDIEIEKS